jgi:hypothetical protein
MSKASSIDPQFAGAVNHRCRTRYIPAQFETYCQCLLTAVINGRRAVVALTAGTSQLRRTSSVLNDLRAPSAKQ